MIINNVSPQEIILYSLGTKIPPTGSVNVTGVELKELSDHVIDSKLLTLGSITISNIAGGLPLTLTEVTSASSTIETAYILDILPPGINGGKAVGGVFNNIGKTLISSPSISLHTDNISYLVQPGKYVFDVFKQLNSTGMSFVRAINPLTNIVYFKGFTEEVTNTSTIIARGMVILSKPQPILFQVYTELDSPKGLGNSWDINNEDELYTIISMIGL